jgi:hypothetical protein
MKIKCVCGNEFEGDISQATCPECKAVVRTETHEDKLIMDFESKLLAQNLNFQEKNFRNIIKEELGIYNFSKSNFDNMDFQFAGLNFYGNRIYIIPISVISLFLSVIILLRYVAKIPLDTILLVMALSFAFTFTVCMFFYFTFFKNKK